MAQNQHTCSSCKRSYALSFQRCPFCNSPADATARTEAPKVPVAGSARLEARAQGAAPRARRAAGTPQWLVKVGVVCAILGATFQGCQWTCARVFGSSDAKVSDLVVAPGELHRVRVGDAFVRWSQKVTVDLGKPIAVADETELLARQAELSGRVVSLAASPAGALVMRSYRLERVEDSAVLQRKELDMQTRVYAPLPNLRVWLLSTPYEKVVKGDPRVMAFVRKGTFQGMLMSLGDVVSLSEIRNPEASSLGMRALNYRNTPDDALALVELAPTHKLPVQQFAPIEHTGDKIWVASERETALGEILEGRFIRCPSKDCRGMGVAELGRPVHGVLLLDPDVAQRIRPSALSPLGLMLLALGIVLVTLGLRRR